MSLPAMPMQAESCIMVLFGASGDLTKRLLTPSLYNLARDGMLPRQFGIVGVAMTDWSTRDFRAHLTDSLHQFTTRHTVQEEVWEGFVNNIHYVKGLFDDPVTYTKLAATLMQLDDRLQTDGNVLFYMATPPSLFGMISRQLKRAGLCEESQGWRRLIVEKPFGHDYASAVALNRALLDAWQEQQLYRIDHYLGKETVQNILAFRFSNGIFEHLWNKHSIDHIQFTVSESVGVEQRGRYYEEAGVIRDMVQSHMFQMLAYICMEPPSRFEAEAIRNEKVKVLQAIRLIKPEEIAEYAVRGQYGPGTRADRGALVGYRVEPEVAPDSNTETFAAIKLFVDNWRWDGVPIYLRSGKRLWKKGTEIIIQFKSAPETMFQGTPVAQLEANRLIFHIQPDQGIELRFQAKVPGPTMELQDVNMRFDYGEAFRDFRGTGYEVLLYNAMIGDATLFSRTDLVETAWQIAQPILDAWSSKRADCFPNYPAGSWGPQEAFQLLARDGRKWIEITNRSILQAIPLFRECDQLFLNALILKLKSIIVEAGDTIVQEGEIGNEMYIISRGRVEVLDARGDIMFHLRDGHFFGELSLLLNQPRNATVRASSHCDLFLLKKSDFQQTIRSSPIFAQSIVQEARRRYNLTVKKEDLLK